jgi:hypothetical protein
MRPTAEQRLSNIAEASTMQRQSREHLYQSESTREFEHSSLERFRAGYIGV